MHDMEAKNMEIERALSAWLFNDYPVFLQESRIVYWGVADVVQGKQK